MNVNPTISDHVCRALQGALGDLPRVDHVGIVGTSIAPLCAAFRTLGFRVSEPVPLLGVDAEGNTIALGQHSAHIVLPNAYIELSAPDVAVPSNHLWPYLERYGPGVRILALACADAATAHGKLVAAGLEPGPIQAAARELAHAAGTPARFRWFPAPVDEVFSALTCWVEQLTPEQVFHPDTMTDPGLAAGVTAVLAPVADPAAVCAGIRVWGQSGGAPASRSYPPLVPCAAMDMAPVAAALPQTGAGRAGAVTALLFACADLPALARCARDRSIPWVRLDDVIWLAPPGVDGIALGFCERR